MPTSSRAGRRAKRSYLPLAAFFTAQPPDVDTIVLTRREIEEVLQDSLPPTARLPHFWRNDDSKLHARAWMTAGWRVRYVEKGCTKITFVRAGR